MTHRRLYLVDANSLYKTAQTQYRGKLDFSFLMDRFREESPAIDFKAVVFHGEPRKGDSTAFQELLKILGFSVVVIPPRMVPQSSTDTRSVPLHLVAHLLPRVGKYTHLDFVVGDVDYSPITSYLVKNGIYVRLWVFADRIPTFHQDEESFHSILPLSEKYILSKTFSYTETQTEETRKAVEFLESPHEGMGVEEFGGEEAPPKPAPEMSKSQKEIKEAYDRAQTKAEKISFALDLGTVSKTGCEDL